jgi:hypothetical protein
VHPFESCKFDPCILLPEKPAAGVLVLHDDAFVSKGQTENPLIDSQTVPTVKGISKIKIGDSQQRFIVTLQKPPLYREYKCVRYS